jgi:hypothetical protein
MWKSLHHIAANYPLAPTEKDEESFTKFFELLPEVLPCVTCKFHFAQLLRADPVRPHVQSRETLSEWVWKAHNTVNTRTGKPLMGYAHITQVYGVSSATPLQRKAVSDFKNKIPISSSSSNSKLSLIPWWKNSAFSLHFSFPLIKI